MPDFQTGSCVTLTKQLCNPTYQRFSLCADRTSNTGCRGAQVSELVVSLPSLAVLTGLCKEVNLE